MQRLKSHPLEEAMNIEPMSTIAHNSIIPIPDNDISDDDDSDDNDLDGDLSQMGVSIVYDGVDRGIDKDLSNVSDLALIAYEFILSKAENIEPRHLPRMAEVARGFLDTALSAASKKADIKKAKDVLNVKLNGTKSLQKEDKVILSTAELIKKIKNGELE